MRGGHGFWQRDHSRRMSRIKRRRRLLLLTRFIGLLVIAGLTIGLFFAFRIGRSSSSGRNVKELFEEAELWRSQGAAAADTIEDLRVKYEKVIQAAPESPWAQRSLLRLAVLERGVGNTRAAFDYLYRIINGYPESNLAAQARYMAGRIWQKDVGDLERALTSFTTVASTYLPMLAPGRMTDVPEYARRTVGPGLRKVVLNALVARANVEVALGRYQDAAHTFELAIEHFGDEPVCPTLKMRLADLYADHLGNRLKRRGLCAEVLSKDPHSIWEPIVRRRLRDAP